jgi:putative membrane protein
LSSTSSSADVTGRRPSATEALASRYRHLFVLPETPILALYGAGLASLVAIELKGVMAIMGALVTTVIILVSAAAVTGILRLSDGHTLASFRRALALVVAGEFAWALCASVGSGASWLEGSGRPVTNAFVFGAFTCAGLEFLIINAVFSKNTILSLALAMIHPGGVIALGTAWGFAGPYDQVAALTGILALASIGGFLLVPAGIRTARGFSGLTLFRGFMRTWAGGEPSELESILAAHSEEAVVSTKVIRLGTSPKETFLVLPGVHPGPFYPIGSYDLPGVVRKSFDGLGETLTLHRPGGHERNLVTEADTSAYAAEVAEYAKTIKLEGSQVRGPLRAKVGKATVTSLSFGTEALMTITFAPLASDDLDHNVELELRKVGAELSLDVSVVDAHNSIDGVFEAPDLTSVEWKEQLIHLKEATPEPYRVAYAHSREVGYGNGADITENGVGVLIIETKAVRHVLVLADANNAVASLRAITERALGDAGFSLLEFCTSDSHNLAAKGLTTSRGYYALGEETPPESIASLVVELARKAETRLAPGRHGAGTLESVARAFGSASLEGFAEAVQAGSRRGRAYLRAEALLVSALFLLALVF